jgi:DNA-binding MarR family transcriptional regulator
VVPSSVKGSKPDAGCPEDGTRHPAFEDRDLYAAWLNLSRIYITIRLELDRAMQQETGISLAEGELLFRLVFAPANRLRMSDLADRLCMAQSGITRVIDRLVERGLVARETRANNRRTVDAILTSLGRKTFERSRPVYQRVIREQLGRALTPRKTARLRAELRVVLAELGTDEEVPWAAREVVPGGKN